jgi:hypothetical protein
LASIQVSGKVSSSQPVGCGNTRGTSQSDLGGERGQQPDCRPARPDEPCLLGRLQRGQRSSDAVPDLTPERPRGLPVDRQRHRLGGVSDIYGEFLDGAGNGQPGSDFVTTVTGKNPLIARPTPRGPAKPKATHPAAEHTAPRHPRRRHKSGGISKPGWIRRHNPRSRPVLRILPAHSCLSQVAPGNWRRNRGATQQERGKLWTPTGPEIEPHAS